jgi:methionine synthase II (cobalamin-independent)
VALFESVKLPQGKTIIPGIIASKSDFIEHPELIAQCIARQANLVGREKVITGSDCGFGTWVGQAAVRSMPRNGRGPVLPSRLRPAPGPRLQIRPALRRCRPAQD